MSWQKLQADLSDTGYVASDDLAMALFLALTLGKPLLLEGPAGVGKTRSPRRWPNCSRTRRLIRLQCYEGLDASHAIYEWNYQRQLLSIRAAPRITSPGEVEDHIFSEKFLLQRPLLEAIRQDKPAGPADRRDRPGRRGIRGLSSGNPVGLPDHHSRDRHHRGDDAAACDPDRERHARPVGRAAAALPLQLCRLSRPANRDGDPGQAVPGARGPAGGADRRFRAGAAQGRAGKEARHRRDARLGRCAGRSRCQRPC
jgi:hypothetical protein